MTLGLGVYHWGCVAYQVCSNDDPRLLALTCLTLGLICFLMHLNGKYFQKIAFFKLWKPKSLFSLGYVQPNYRMAINKS